MEASRNRKSKRAPEMNENVDDDDDDDFDDLEVWDTLTNGFKRAQLVLDQNRDLIERVNDNHRSRSPDNVARNVGFINEINHNITRVMEIYSKLSDNFTKSLHERRKTAKNSNTTTSTTDSYGGKETSSGS